MSLDAGAGDGKVEEKPNEDDQLQSIEQQETMKIKGTNQRHMIMQKLMRKSTEVRTYSKTLLSSPF